MAESVIPVRVVEERLRAVEEQIRALSTEREMLIALVSHAVSIDRPLGERTVGPITALSTLTDTVVRFVAENPGLTSGAISDAFMHSNLQIGGADPRKTLLTTIAALVQKRRLHRDESTGGHYVIER